MGKKTKKATRKRGIARNLEAVAAHFGVGTRTVGTWRAAGMPGRSGAWDLSKIRGWLEVNELGPYRRPADQSERSAILAEIERAKLLRIHNQLIDVNEVIAITTGFISEARALLEQLPERVAAAMPETLASEDLAMARDEARKVVHGVLAVFSDWWASAKGLDPNKGEQAGQTVGGA